MIHVTKLESICLKTKHFKTAQQKQKDQKNKNKEKTTNNRPHPPTPPPKKDFKTCSIVSTSFLQKVEV